jgi:hypothetical protein
VKENVKLEELNELTVWKKAEEEAANAISMQLISYVQY